MDPVENTIKRVQAYFLEGQKNTDTTSSLIKVHADGALKNFGDFSFPTARAIWQNYFTQHSDGGAVRLCDKSFQLFENDGGDTGETKARIAEFIAKTSTWPYPVERLEIRNKRCALFLERKAVVLHMLSQVLGKPDGVASTYGYLRKNPTQQLHLQQEIICSDNDDLSVYRVELIKDTLARVLEYSKWTILEEPNAATNSNVLTVNVQTVKGDYQITSTDKTNVKKDNTVTIKCGILIDPITGKLAKIQTEEYLKLRSNDMLLMALHKYGVRSKDDPRFNGLIERIGRAAVTVDLLEVKHSSPVQIIRNGQGSTRGASFILYNSARMETLLRSFEERVQNSTYDKLPDFNDIDVSLLNEEEEWQLIFGYIFTFPNLIERCVDQIEAGSCAVHLIVRYLTSLVAVFSVYYRRIRILTDKRDHLMPHVYARIYLIKALREILNKSLALLGIEPVMFM